MRSISFEGRTVRLGAMLGAAALSITACNTKDVLNVYDPAVATPGSLQSESAVPTVYYGALGDFAAAWDGNGLTDAFVPSSGLLADEFRSSDTFTTRNDADRRTQASPANGNLSDNSYVSLHRARRSLEVGASLVTKFNPATDPRAAELTALAGYTYLAFGEGFCGNVPVPPTAEAEKIVPAAGIGTKALFDTAAVRFSAAIAGLGASPTGTAATAALNLARVGLGRALIDAGKYPEALAAVAQVPTSFVYKIFYSSNTNREQNSLWNLNGSNNRYTMADTEGTNGLNYRSANDPRIPWKRLGNGFDQVTPVYQQLLQPTADADVPLADGVEARLIQAEALLKAGNASWLDTLNVLRASVGTLQNGRYADFATVSTTDSVTVSTLAPLVDPGTAAARVDMLFRERAFWLYATGHRLGDMRRLIRDYGRTAATVFPVGTSTKLGVYGNDVNMAISFAEQNNTAYNPSACVTTTP
jgi:starch-binding outer membrane protein, SusD/RagB family